MKDIVYNLASGHGKIKRSIQKMEFGTLVLEPFVTIGKHAHRDDNGFKHCEIYLIFSRNIHINGKYRLISVCRNSEHRAINVSRTKKGKIHFLKLWW